MRGETVIIASDNSSHWLPPTSDHPNLDTRCQQCLDGLGHSVLRKTDTTGRAAGFSQSNVRVLYRPHQVASLCVASFVGTLCCYNSHTRCYNTLSVLVDVQMQGSGLASEVGLPLPLPLPLPPPQFLAHAPLAHSNVSEGGHPSQSKSITSQTHSSDLGPCARQHRVSMTGDRRWLVTRFLQVGQDCLTR